MSGWGILAAGLAGGARAVGGIAEGKIDQERRLESAQAIADIEEQKQKRIAEWRRQNARDDQTYNTVGEGGQNARAAEGLLAQQRNEIALKGAEAAASSNVLTDAQINRENAIIEGTAPAKIKAEVDRAKEMLPVELKRVYAIAEAQARASASHRQSPVADLQAKMDFIEQTLGRALTEQERLGILGLAKTQQMDEVTTVNTVEDQATGNKRETRIKSMVPSGAMAQTHGSDQSDPFGIRSAMDAERAARAAKDTKARPPFKSMSPVKTPPTQADIDELKRMKYRTEGFR